MARMLGKPQDHGACPYACWCGTGRKMSKAAWRRVNRRREERAWKREW